MGDAILQGNCRAGPGGVLARLSRRDRIVGEVPR